MPNDIWSTRAYVLGEILLSVIILVGGGLLLLYNPSPMIQALIIGLLPTVVVFWFSRRATEQATNKVAEISNGNLKNLSERIDALAAKMGDK